MVVFVKYTIPTGFRDAAAIPAVCCRARDGDREAVGKKGVGRLKTDRARHAGAETADQILDVAERFVQTRGFNGFSYADIAAEIGLTKASLHYHFPAKADLGARLIERYHERFETLLQAIDRDAADSAEKVRCYAGIYLDVFRNDRMCLCGMLAAEHATLPESMRRHVGRFFAANEAWLSRALADGRNEGSLSFAGDPVSRAHLLVSALEGALLIARSHGDAVRLAQTIDRLLADIGVRCAPECGGDRPK